MPDIITTTLAESPSGTTQFCRRDSQLWLARLGGMPTGWQGEDTSPARIRGMALLHIDGRRYEAGDLVLEAVEESNDAVVARWRIGDTPIGLTTRWQGCSDTGIISRRDTLSNTGESPVTLSRCLARLTFPSGRYECYTQAGSWCNENQGAWQPLFAGLTLRHAWGRTTEESAPYLALRAVGTDQGLAFHILPQGNWTIRVTPVVAGAGSRELPFAVVELGLADENLHRVMPPGETLELPEILIQPLPRGKPHLGAPDLHRYLFANQFADAKPEAPVVYNTFFDEFEILDVPRLRGQLAAAKTVGCEVFVIDSGWYGTDALDWWSQVGDWREKTGAAFHGRMRDFADEVRAAGLGFGLWIEPERFGPSVPILGEHPEWFVPFGAAARIDLTQPAAYAYLRGEIGRLVETYDLAWMKMDFNSAFDADAAGSELHDYTTAWYRLLDEIRTAYPNTFFEGCSSGAMRGDLTTLAHFDGHFLSDSVNPVDMLRISQGAWLRLPPGRLTRWTVVRPAGQVLPQFAKRVADSPATVLATCGALWEPAETVDLSFALLTAMPGMLGLSGDLAGLSPEQHAEIAQGIAFFKHWRRFIIGAVAHLLTSPELSDRRQGWIGVQLQTPPDDTSLVFVYRLGNTGAPPPLRLRDLKPDMRYAVSRGFGDVDTTIELTGAELMRDGVSAFCCGKSASWQNSADVLIVKASTRHEDEYTSC